MLKATQPLLFNILDIIKLINQYLNKFTYGYINKNGKLEIDNFTDYFTYTIDQFLLYRCGRDYDFINYEYIWFLQHGFLSTLNNLVQSKTFSNYYIEGINKYNKIISHTWIGFNINGNVYNFESSWKKIQGVKYFNTELEMCKYYMNILSDCTNIVIYKYCNTHLYGQTEKEFIMNCKILSNRIL